MEDENYCTANARTIWDEIQRIADEYNDNDNDDANGENFTTLIAYEYTGLFANQGMLHRNVFFRNKNVIPDPIVAIETPNAKDLWAELERQCNDQENTIDTDDSLPDCEALTIAHNPNYSWGVMLDPEKDSTGSPWTPEELELRAKVERGIEMIQTKGSSECYNGLDSTDELCDFEQVFPMCETEGTTENIDRCVVANSFVRNAFKNGMVMEEDPGLGVNPFKFGVIASTDTHNGTAGATKEDEYNGHHANTDDTPEERVGGGVEGLTENPANNPGGLAAVWAPMNTRAGIFDALKRKETFGTSGTRISVRFFGSFAYYEDTFNRGWPYQIIIDYAYDNGVPMGGDLEEDHASGPNYPKFIVWAWRDVDSAPLQKVQIIKGWYDGTDTFEEVHDVICADGSPPPSTSDGTPPRCEFTGSVNTDTCEISPATTDSTDGAGELQVVWTDTGFNPIHRAFYYVRVLENPTCRWSTRDANYLNSQATDTCEQVVAPEPKTIQERAWTSPIWYSPPPTHLPETDA